MDPISQGVAGAVVSGANQPKKHTNLALLCGAFAGISADIDVFISSPTDPLLFLEYHRQFTHSLVFIPFGAAICSALLWHWVRQHIDLRRLYLSCLLGFASHGLLDTCTTYGTQLFWPFSEERFAWNIISIIDSYSDCRSYRIDFGIFYTAYYSVYTIMIIKPNVLMVRNVYFSTNKCWCN